MADPVDSGTGTEQRRQSDVWHGWRSGYTQTLCGRPAGDALNVIPASQFGEAINDGAFVCRVCKRAHYAAERERAELLPREQHR